MVNDEEPPIKIRFKYLRLPQPFPPYRRYGASALCQGPDSGWICSV